MPEIFQSSSGLQNLANHPIAAEPIDSELLNCSICKHKYDCDSRPQVPHVLPACGHTICAGCIEQLAEVALRNNSDCFQCPYCDSRQPVDSPCPTNWIIKSHIDGLRSSVKVKRKRPAPEPLPPAQDLASTCPRHADALAEVVCVDCGVLECLSCGFDCSQMQHKCIKTSEEAIAQEISRSVSKLDSIFETGSEKIQQRLQEEIRKKEAAAQVLKRQLFNLCEENKRKTADDLKTAFKDALTQKNTHLLVNLFSGTADLPIFDVDVSDKLVLRRFFKIRYDNGTVYEGFVDEETGRPDGDGTVTWGHSAGRSRGKSYAGRFAAGLTADRIKFTWKEHRAGQACAGHHAYCGTVEVESGAWTGNAYIQYDTTEGGHYEGGVCDGKYHGVGRLVDTLGQETEGNWRHGQFQDASKRVQ